jgi:steroid delta-isomerase-like uncharacterized protein
MSEEEDYKSIVRDYNRAVNTGDYDNFDRTLGDDYIHHNSQGTYCGRDQFKEELREFRDNFPDLEIRIESQIAEGDTVVNRVLMTGTHEGPFAGVPASHKKVKASGLAMFRFEDGKIAEHWAEYDLVGMLGQIGAMPYEEPTEDC